jgi:hypothetical protein
MSREVLEWTHYNSREGEKKILVIGDSIMWGSHQYIESALPQGVALTIVATAHGVNEEQYVKSVSMLATLNDKEYEAVYFNNGLHPRGQSVSEYSKNYESALKRLMSEIPSKKWILGLSTPISSKQTKMWEDEAPITEKEIILLDEKNELVLLYNRCVKEISEKLGLPYFDAYSLAEGKDNLKTDPYHYNDEGKKLIGNAVCKRIMSEINNLTTEERYVRDK